MALSPDDPARAKYAELRSNGASKEEIMDAMDTFNVPCSLLIRALSPGHAQAVASDLVNHMIDTHLEPGLGAVSSIGEATKQAWLDGPLFGGPLND